jgi:hypothetical protein
MISHTIGRGGKFILDQIVRLLTFFGIQPNLLTFTGVVISSWAAWHFGRGWFATLEGQTAGGMFMDDANTLRSSGWEVMNARVGGRVSIGTVSLAPVVAVSNLFDRTYAGSIVINAAGGRYFEPSPGQTFYAGLTVGLGR